MTCEGCKYSKNKLTFLGMRKWCKIYKKFTNARCIDYPEAK